MTLPLILALLPVTTPNRPISRVATLITLPPPSVTVPLPPSAPEEAPTPRYFAVAEEALLRLKEPVLPA